MTTAFQSGAWQDNAFQIDAGGLPVWPDPSVVLLGVTYGPTGADYTGTYVPGIMFELTTGNLIKPLSPKVALML